MTSAYPLKPLGELVDIFDHVRVPLSAAQRSTRSGPYPYYGAQGVIDHIDDYLFDGRYLLIPEDGENLNSRKQPIAYFADGRFWVNNHAHVVRAKPDVANDIFLKHAINSLDIRAYVTGAAQPKLSQASLKRMAIPAPPLAVQFEIASLLGAYDELIEVNRRRIALLEEMARGLFEEWFVHFRFPGHEGVSINDTPAGPLPEGWRTGKASDLVEFDPSTPIQRDDAKPFISMGLLNTTTSLIAPFELRVGKSGAKFKNDDTLLARITPCLENGKTGLVRDLPGTGSGFGSTEFIVMRGGAAGPAFTYCLARFPAFRRHAERGMRGASGRQRTSKEVVSRFPIAIPPPDAAVLEDFEQIAWPMLRLVGSLGRANEILAGARDLLLPRLISGQLSLASAEQQPGEAAKSAELVPAE